MTDTQLEFIRNCIKINNLHAFYNSPDWRHLRRDVLAMDKQECQMCKKRGKYTRATTVHHVNYVKVHPELALSIYYTWQGVQKRNLLSLCHDCHEEVHGYRKPARQQPLTEERW